jgi:hypothetical protein
VTVYVDNLTVYPNAWGPYRKGSCHLTADTDEELHVFALRIGMRRAWFQEHRVMNHYDLTGSKRAEAVAAGAVEMSFREQHAMRAARGAP